MAWIESHQALRKHPKTLMAVLMLKTDRHKFLGHLHCLWWWGLDVADKEGVLPSGTTPLVIADAAEWPLKKADAFVDALISCKGRDEDDEGFLSLQEGRYVLHDWPEYAGRLNDLRVKRSEAGRRGGVKSGEARREAKEGLLEANTPANEPPTNLTNLTNQQDQPNLTTPTTVAVSPSVFELYSRVFGPGMTDFIRDELIDLEREHSPTCLERHFNDAGMIVPRPRTLKYVTTKLNHVRAECDQPTRLLSVVGASPAPSMLYGYEEP